MDKIQQEVQDIVFQHLDRFQKAVLIGSHAISGGRKVHKDVVTLMAGEAMLPVDGSVPNDFAQAFNNTLAVLVKTVVANSDGRGMVKRSAFKSYIITIKTSFKEGQNENNRTEGE